MKLKNEIGIVPYHDYCLHCDSYRASIEKAGFKYIYNFQGMDHAACSILIYDPKIFDGRVIVDEDTVVMERKASENEYFHRDFHSSMNMGIHYVGENYGMEGVRDYLTRYTNNVYRTVLHDMKERGLVALKEKIQDTYEKEKAADALETKLLSDGRELQVVVKYCPAVQHLKETGREVSRWYRYTTEIVMGALADANDYVFAMDSYDEVNGAAVYRFYKK